MATYGATLVFAPFAAAVTACHSVPADTPTEFAHNAISRPTNPLPRRSLLEFPAEEFAKVRNAILSEKPAFDYTTGCIPKSEKLRFYSGGEKFVCQLTQFPEFALLIAKTPGAGLLEEELAGFSKIHEGSGGQVDVAPTGPIDTARFLVPCVRPTDKEHSCEAFLEPWFDHGAYAWWQENWGQRLREIIFPMLELKDHEAMGHVCRGLRGWLAFSEQGFVIGDPQGVVGIEGPDRGHIIMLDPGPIDQIEFAAGLTTQTLKQMIDEFGCLSP